jgi:RNA polymerase sigma factor for flagellar operon FliA
MTSSLQTAVRAYQDVRRKSARDALILEHLPLVRQALGRLMARLPEDVDRENLESAGVCGLVQAAGQFDESRGVSFVHFAYPRVRGAMLDELRRNCPLPQHMLERWSQIRDAYARLNEEATPERLAAETGLTLAEVEECLQAIQLTRPDAWHDDLADRVASDDEQTSPLHQLETAERLQLVAEIIETLPTQMRLAFTLYYRENLRLKEIGEVLSLSESRVSRILSSAELLIRERVQARLR